MKPTLLLSDYDQTLYFKDSQLIPTIIQALEGLKKRYGLTLGIVTGNNRKKILKTWPPEAFKLFDFIADHNAGGLWFQGQDINQPSIQAPWLEPGPVEKLVPPESVTNWGHCAAVNVPDTQDVFDRLSEDYAVYREGTRFVIYPRGANKVQIFDRIPEIEAYLGSSFGQILYLGDQIYPNGNDYDIASHPRVNRSWLIKSPEHSANILRYVLPSFLTPIPKPA